MVPVYKKNTLLSCLDALVKWTPLPDLAAGSMRRRRMPYLPLLTLALAVLGLGWIVCYPQRYWPGYAMLVLGMGVGNFLPLFGPLKQPGNVLEEVDEREQAWRREAYLVTFVSISVTAMLGIWGLIAMTAWQDWPREVLLRAMLGLSLLLMALFSSLPTLYASWAMPAEEVDEEG